MPLNSTLPRLSFLVALFLIALVPRAGAANFAGLYSGTHTGSSLGEFFAHVGSDNKLTVWSYDATWDESSMDELTVAANGTFSGIVGYTSVSGSVTSGGNVSGTGSGAFGTVSFSGSKISSTGSVGNLSGFYEGTATTSLGGATLSVAISGDGTIWIYTEASLYENGGKGTVASNGSFTIVDAELLTFSGIVNSTTLEITGTVKTTEENTSIGTFMLSPSSGVVTIDEDSYENDDSPNSAKTIVNGVEQTRSIHEIGNADWLTFTIPQETFKLSVQTPVPGGIAHVAVYGPNSSIQEVGSSASGNLYIDELTPGVYYLKVEDSGNDEVLASYSVTVGWSPIELPEDEFESDNTKIDATEIENEEIQTHSIHTAGDVDWITFTADNEITSFYVSSDPGNGVLTDIRIFGPDSGSELSGQVSEGRAFSKSFISSTSPWPAGTYYVKTEVANSNPILTQAIEGYDLYVEWTESDPNSGDTFEQDNAPDIAKSILSGASQDRSLHVAGDVDYVKLTIVDDDTEIKIDITDVITESVNYLDLELFRGPYQVTSDGVAYIAGSALQSDGTNIADPTANITRTLAAGEYYIRISGDSINDRIESYTLSINGEGGPGDGGGDGGEETPEGDAYEIDDTSDLANSIANGGSQAHSIHDLGDLDWAFFTVTDTFVDATIKTVGASGYTKLSLYASSDLGNAIASNTYGEFGTLSSIAYSLDAGTYYVKVEENGNNATIGSYSLDVSWTAKTKPSEDAYEADDTAATAKSIANGVSQNRSMHTSVDVDWVKFTVETGATDLLIETSGTTGNTEINFYGPDDSTAYIWLNDNGGIGDFSKLSSEDVNLALIPAGTYYIKVESDGSIANYSLQVSWTETIPSSVGYQGDEYEWDDSASAAKEIGNGVVQNRSIHTSGYDWATFTLESDMDDLSVLVTPAGQYASLSLYGPRFGVDRSYIAAVSVRGTDDSLTISNANSSLGTLAAGTYYVQLFGIEVLDYALTVSWASGTNGGGGSDTSTLFETWLDTYLGGYSSNDRETAADPDGDGLSNIVEYAIGTDPSDPSNTRAALEIFKSLSMQQSEIALTLRSNDDKLITKVQSSTNLEDWSDSLLEFENDTWTISGDTLVISATEDLGNDHWSIKLTSQMEGVFVRLALSFE